MPGADVNAESGPRVPAILPRDGGHSFVWYGDCCSGVPGHHREANFAAVNAVFRRLDAVPDVVIFAGDDVIGSGNPDEHRAQWHYLLDHEMAWFADLDRPIYRIPSNHNTPNAAAETVFREVLPELPANGPAGQEGLSYWARRGGDLLVFVNTNFSGIGGTGHVEHEWLNRILEDQADAPRKLVVGHHPVFPVNGYDTYPGWRIVPDEGEAFWDTLVRHEVFAYLCSHIIAYDVQVHEGVPQICTGGAGTNAGPDEGMPGTTEYYHLIQGALDDDGLRYQVLDTEGQAREWFVWPLALDDDGWHVLESGKNPAISAPAQDAATAWIERFRVSGTAPAEVHGEHTLVCGWDNDEAPATIWLGLAGAPLRLVVQLVPRPGYGVQRWFGPVIAPGQPFEFEIAIHGGMGPGGIMWREPLGRWSSLLSSTAFGADRLRWPREWAVGHAQSGPDDAAFQGTRLRAAVHRDLVPFLGLRA